jgi:hypothetical protein
MAISCQECGTTVFVNRDVSYSRKVTGSASCNGCGSRVDWESPKNTENIFSEVRSGSSPEASLISHRLSHLVSQFKHTQTIIL